MSVSRVRAADLELTGTRSLDDSESDNINALLQVYRIKAGFGSTTRHQVTFTQRRGDQTIASESYTHVGPRTHENDKILSFDLLADDPRLEK
jgi:hypothetical protein